MWLELRANRDVVLAAVANEGYSLFLRRPRSEWKVSKFSKARSSPSVPRRGSAALETVAASSAGLRGWAASDVLPPLRRS